MVSDMYSKGGFLGQKRLGPMYFPTCILATGVTEQTSVVIYVWINI